MVVRNRQHKKPKESPVDLAVAAVIGPPSVMDMPIGGFDPSPSALGIGDLDEPEICARGRCACTEVDRCPTCGCQLCEDGVWQ
jgi:hypothetical protein